MTVLKHASTPFILPLTAALGIVACQLWRWTGVAFCSVFLAAALVYALQSQPSSLWLWIIVLSLSIASSFVVSVLCSEESNHVLDSLGKEITDHKQTTAYLNERLHAIQNKHVAEITVLNQQMTQLQQQLSAKEEKQRSNEQLIRLARQEIIETHEKQEKLTQEILLARQNEAALQLKMNELQNSVPSETTSNPKIQEIETQHLLNLQELNSYIQELESKISNYTLQEESLRALNAAKESLEIQLQQLVTQQQEKEASQKESLNALHTEKESLEIQLQQLVAQQQEKEVSQQESLNALHAEKESLEIQLQQIVAQQQEKEASQQESLNALHAEKESLETQLQQLVAQQQEKEASQQIPQNHREVRRVEGLYLQLREQFTQKSEQLSATRRELFATQEKLLALQKELEETQLYEDGELIEPFGSFIQAADREFALLECEHKTEVNYLHNLVDSLIAR